MPKTDNNAEQNKSKSKGKGKGKSKGDTLPRFDLAQQWPKRDITAWQAVQSALEGGEAPKGGVCICKTSAQIEEFQVMAKALNVDKDLVLVCKFAEEDSVPPGATKTLMPYLGNLAMTYATIANLNGKDIKISGYQPKETKIEDNKQDLITLRVTIQMHYIPKEHHKTLFGRPELALRLAGVTEELRTYKWESVGGCIIGYVSCTDAEHERLLANSGSGGIFFARLAQDITARPAVSWVDKTNNGDQEQGPYDFQTWRKE